MAKEELVDVDPDAVAVIFDDLIEKHGGRDLRPSQIAIVRAMATELSKSEPDVDRVLRLERLMPRATSKLVLEIVDPNEKTRKENEALRAENEALRAQLGDAGAIIPMMAREQASQLRGEAVDGDPARPPWSPPCPRRRRQKRPRRSGTLVRLGF